MIVECFQCKKEVEKKAGHVNRSKKLGLKNFCSHKCFGLSRRKTQDEKKEIKRLYDIEYRSKNEKRLKKIRHGWFIKDYAANPEKYKERRRKKQPKHNEYCSQPEYKKWKKGYDQKYHSRKKYGKFWEAAVALHQLRGIVDNRRAKAEQHLINKTQKRKRNATKNIKRQELESCTVGIYQPR